jgi:DNA-binding winged helix-turn-helix (wHTH) protein
MRRATKRRTANATGGLDRELRASLAWARRRGAPRVILRTRGIVAAERFLILRFAEFELDDALSELRRGGVRIEIQPKTLDLLLYLARNRERVVSKRELLEQVWPGVVVSEGALTTAVNTARAVLLDTGVEKRVIQTVPRRGYRFVAEISAPPAPAPTTSDGFIGREDALARLWAAFELARSGTGSVVLLAGEPGIGKTRTAEEFAAAARAAGARVLSGWCYEGDGAPPYWPWVQVLRTFASEVRESDAPRTSFEEIARLVPELAKRSPVQRDARAFDGPEARFRLYDEVAAFLRAASQREPLVVLLDDLHWADTSSLRLLAFVAREVRESRLLIVGTYRHDDASRAPLTEVLADLARRPQHERIALAGLSRAEVGQLVARSGRIDPAPALVDAICERTDGNPFFIRELVRMLEAEGRLAGSESRTAWKSAIPPAVKDVIARRLARLSAESRELLGAASVIGRDFALDVLERASGVTRDEMTGQLGEAERAREIRPHPTDPQSFRIVHALIQEVLYEDLGTARRRALHRRVAEALESLVRDRLDPPLAELAHHWCLGASAEDAAHVTSASSRAARAALARLAYEEAAALCRRALATLDGLHASAPEGRCDLLALLVEAEFDAGNGPQWREALKQAVAIARKLGSPQRLAHVAIHVGDIVTGVVDWQAVALYEESLAAVGPGEGALRAELLSGLACALYWSPSDRERVRALADEALALARRIGSPEVLAAVLNNRHLALWGPDSLADRIATSTELLEIAERLRSRSWMYYGYHRHLLDALESADSAAAERDGAAIDRLSAELRFPGFASPPGGALRALLDGRLEQAETLARERFEHIQRAGFSNASTFFAIQLAGVRREQGRLGELESGMRLLAEQLPNMPTWRATLAYLYAEDQREEPARIEFERLAGKDFADIPRDATWLTTIGLLAEVAAFLGDAPRARTLASLLAPYMDRAIIVGPSLSVMSSVARTAALALATSGDLQGAELAFEHALAIELRLGARCLATRTRQQYAALLAEREGEGDRARSLAAEALSAAESIGMRAVAARARVLVEQLTGVIPIRRRRGQDRA